MRQEGAAIQVFAGMVSNSDPMDLAPGQARIQVNCWSARPGELQTRQGIRLQEAEDE